MKLQGFKLLTDENIHRDVVSFLRSQGCDVRDVSEEGHFGTPDVDLLRTRLGWFFSRHTCLPRGVTCTGTTG
jgi:hypothetical protein